MQASIDLGEKAASAAIQSNWRRFFQQRKFARILIDKEASAQKIFASTKNMLARSTETELSVVDMEVDLYPGLVR